MPSKPKPLSRSRQKLDDPAAKPADSSAQTRPVEGKANAAPRADKETGGPKGLEPTRYGDWERKGRCIDF